MPCAAQHRWNIETDALVNSSKSEKLLDFETDNKLTFDEHIRSKCKKPTAKLSALIRVFI